MVGLTDLPFRIVVTLELAGPEYAAYRALKENADKGDIDQVLRAGDLETDPVMRDHYRVLLDFYYKKNP